MRSIHLVWLRVSLNNEREIGIMESEIISLFQIINRNDGPQCLLCDINNPPPKRGKGDDKVDDMDSKKSKPRSQSTVDVSEIVKKYTSQRTCGASICM